MLWKILLYFVQLKKISFFRGLGRTPRLPKTMYHCSYTSFVFHFGVDENNYAFYHRDGGTIKLKFVNFGILTTLMYINVRRK